LVLVPFVGALALKVGSRNELPQKNIFLQISLPVKKESKSERVFRQQKEIESCVDKVRELVDYFGDTSACLFCQQSRVVPVDVVFLISHLIIVHDRAAVEQVPVL
jgi:hypothetical protein